MKTTLIKNKIKIMNRKITYGGNLILFISVFFISSSCVQTKNIKINQKNSNIGLINDKKTAIKIGETILNSVYGEKINKFKPFKAKLINNTVWRIEGTLYYDVGGVPYIEIQSKDCKVIRFGKGK